MALSDKSGFNNGPLSNENVKSNKSHFAGMSIDLKKIKGFCKILIRLGIV